MRSSHGATAQHEPRILRDARESFKEIRGEAGYQRRAAEIAALPDTTFKGKALKVLRCNGVRGKGPHDCNVPESLLWILMDLGNFCCVFHHGDQMIASHGKQALSEASGSAQSAAQKSSSHSGTNSDLP